MGQIKPGQPTVILDVDDTLSDTTARRYLVEPPEGVKKDWSTFYEQCHLDTERDWMVDFARQLSAAGAQIAVFTGRPHSQRGPTLDWLRVRGIEPSLARFRGPRNFKKSATMKGLWLDEMIAAGVLPMAAVDDEAENLAAFAARGVLTVNANDRVAAEVALLGLIASLKVPRPHVELGSVPGGKALHVPPVR